VSFFVIPLVSQERQLDRFVDQCEEGFLLSLLRTEPECAYKVRTYSVSCPPGNDRLTEEVILESKFAFGGLGATTSSTGWLHSVQNLRVVPSRWGKRVTHAPHNIV
jgi:hypothetical protein